MTLFSSPLHSTRSTDITKSVHGESVRKKPTNGHPVPLSWMRRAPPAVREPTIPPESGVPAIWVQSLRALPEKSSHSYTPSTRLKRAWPQSAGNAT